MKKCLIITTLCLILSTPAFASDGPLSHPKCVGEVTSSQGRDTRHLHEHCYEDKDTQTSEKNADALKLGLKADAPNLIRLTENSTIGVEGGKDMRHTSSSEGWFGFLKFTWTGTLFDRTKD